jgi:Flp pilus assembly protein TadG
METIPTTSRIRRRSLRRQEGAAAVEFALLASILFVLVFGIIDFGFAFHAWNDTSNAAREGARRAIVDPSVTQIESRVRAATETLDQTKLTVSIRCSRNDGISFAACGAGSTWTPGDVVRVTVDYDYDLITPLAGLVPGVGDTISVHSVSEARFEGQ